MLDAPRSIAHQPQTYRVDDSLDLSCLDFIDFEPETIVQPKAMGRAKAKKNVDRDGRIAELEGAMLKFSLTYGRDEERLEKWQLLCEDCGLESGKSITKCKAGSSNVLLTGLYPH